MAHNDLVLVTGGSGFISSAVGNRLSGEYHMNPLLLIRGKECTSGLTKTQCAPEREQLCFR